MCGLFGAMGPGLIYKDFDILKNLGTVSQLRGMDGAGVMQVKSMQYRKGWDKQESLHKTYSNFSSMITDIEDHRNDKNYPEYKDLFRNVQADVVLCHVRKATMGNITDENAHPFIFHNLVGAHNGTLRDKKYQDKKKTDSEMMFADMSARGMTTVLKELDKMSAYAITMYNRMDHRMYFARNSDRTLSFAFLKRRGVMYWASEVEMLKYVLNRESEEFETFNLRPYRILSVYAGDVTMSNIQSRPADIHTLVEELQDPFAKAGATVTVPTVATKDTATVKLIEDKRGQTPVTKETNLVFTKKETEGLRTGNTGTVLQFPNEGRKRKVLSAFHGLCKCKKHRLNILQMNYLKKGQLADFRFNDQDGDIYCRECDPLKKAVQKIVGEGNAQTI